MFAAALPLVVVVAGPVSGQPWTPGVTDLEVVIGVTAPLSGPAAAWGATALGAEAWARHVNARGGVQGRRIRTVVMDDGYSPDRTVANVRDLQGSVLALVGLVGNAACEASRGLVAEKRLPTVWPFCSPRVFARKSREGVRSVFMVSPDHADEAEFLVRQAVRLEQARRVAVFYQNDDFGRAGLEGVRRAARSLSGGVTIVGEVAYDAGARDLGSHALRLKSSHADAVILYASPGQAAGIVREMAGVRYRPRLFASSALGDLSLMYGLLGELWEGAYYDVTTAVPGEPEADRVIEILTRLDPRLRGRERLALAGAAAMMVVVEGLRRAGGELTREGFIEALQSLHAWDPEQLTAPITFGPNRRHGLNAVRLQQAGRRVDGSFVPVSGYEVFQPHF